MGVLIRELINQMCEVQNRKLWMGENYERKLEEITEGNPFKRPLDNLHSVAEIISHLTCWRKETLIKLRTGSGKITDGAGENWLGNENLVKLGWPTLLDEYRKSLIEIIDFLEDKEDDFLNTKYYDTDFQGNYEYRFVLNGMLHHDIHHLGQIGIIIKLLNEQK